MILLMLCACSFTAEKQQPETYLDTTRPEYINDITDTQILTGSLKVLSLNVAHGRGDALNQLFVCEETIRDNLKKVANVFKKTEADIVALQEADGPSLWSGNFNHVSELAHQANYLWHYRAGHAQSWLFDYGAALLSKRAFVEAHGYSFAPTPPTTIKGFVLGQFAWHPREDSRATIPIDVVSVHLDFSRSNVREQQISELAELIGERNNPLIILGDFNSDWLSKDSVVKALALRLKLNGYQPEANNYGTYKSGQHRFDWILISNELEFKSYRVLPDILSDHYAVVAEVMLKDSADIKAQKIFKSERPVSYTTQILTGLNKSL